ncbi:MFS transporter [Neobacillus mesonae]|nr:MFS transporter [Neobacillus mesonae]
MSLWTNKNFWMMFLGRVVTNIGDSLYAVAAMWLVAELGGSTFFTGLAGFLSIVPRFIQFFSGPFIDRIAIRPLLIISQLTQAAIVLVIPLADYMGFLTVGLVLIIFPILSSLNMLVYPAQMSALPKFVEPKDLSKANSLFTFANQGIDTGCNAIAGILIVSIGAVSIYLVDSITFLAGTLIFSLIRLPKSADKEQINKKEKKMALKLFLSNYKIELVEGIRLLLGKSFSRLLLGVIVINFVGGATFVVLPEFGRIHGGAEIYGYLLMAQAMGSMLGALLAPYLKLERFGMGKVYAGAFLISGLLWSLSMLSSSVLLSVTIYGLAWLPGGVTNILINTYLQKGIPQHLLGRVFSASYSLSGIAMPIGSLLGGILGQIIGAPMVILFSGIAVFLVGVYWSIDKTTRGLPNSKDVNETTLVSTSVT